MIIPSTIAIVRIVQAIPPEWHRPENDLHWICSPEVCRAMAKAVGIHLPDDLASAKPMTLMSIPLKLVDGAELTLCIPIRHTLATYK